MEMKAHYKGRRLRKGGRKIKTKEQSKKGKERKNDERKNWRDKIVKLRGLNLRLLKKVKKYSRIVRAFMLCTTTTELKGE